MQMMLPGEWKKSYILVENTLKKYLKKKPNNRENAIYFLIMGKQYKKLSKQEDRC